MESKQIIGFEDYTVFANGYIINKFGKFLKPELNKNGYLYVVLYKNKKRKSMLLHRLICQAFNENQYNKKYVDHIDHNKLNNWISNLRWVTLSENQKNHSKKENTMFRGVSFHKTKKAWISGYYNSEGKRKLKTFSVNKYGNKNALARAVEHRYQAELLYDYTILQTPSDFFESDIFISISD
jgi:hypothetical protein